MRIARDMGTVSQLLPDGIRKLRDAPYTFTHAVKAALRFLSFEEMAEEDVPPHHIWLDSKAMKEHFLRVKRRHKEQFSGKGEIEDPQSNAALDLLIVD